ncbi:ABC transporter permease [Streptacidiphilus jiangxiensis]|uniref:Peptide/nickel transport system permease protein n=1 Tax=Streptacidiphilus jiangxiensis TaxID=235985 RepID=A0A1H7TC61_STRJI|nr:ABC transporter permease [Streptacidiphilus jiangxiensis]SEL82452.1 peptide/nickel transport system permease protein [Streptacidiphilus jiangxiensis]
MSPVDREVRATTGPAPLAAAAADAALPAGSGSAPGTCPASESGPEPEAPSTAGAAVDPAPLTGTALPAVAASASGAGAALRALARRAGGPGGLLAFAVLLLLVLVAAWPGLFTSAQPDISDPVHAFLAPSTAHPFGTDQLGRDILARVLYGARLSLLLGAGSTVLSVAAGSVLGLLAGIGGRWADQALMRLADVLFALPPILLALLTVAVLGSGTSNVMLAIAVAFAPGYARLVRGETLVVRRSGYVEAAVGLGLPRPLLVVRHVLPNALGPVLVLATVGFGSALITASGLSFLGLGPQPPAPEWGTMLSEGRNNLANAWWTAVFPGVAITVTVLAVGAVGRRAQARFTRRTAR